MVEQYDNTNSGACFKPYNQEDRLILSGKININGEEHRVVCINEETKTGTKVVQMYTKLCTLWNNDKTNDNQPDKSGPIEEKFNKDTPLKISAWRKKDKNGSDYLSLSVSEKMQKRTEFDGGYQHMEEKKTPIDDDIPF